MLQFNLHLALPFCAMSGGAEERCVVNASAPSSGSEAQLHCD